MLYLVVTSKVVIDLKGRSKMQRFIHFREEKKESSTIFTTSPEDKLNFSHYAELPLHVTT
jgi:hypothetical protein